MKYKLTRVSIKDNKDGVLLKTKKGEQYWQIGIQTEQTGDVWHSGVAFNKDDASLQFKAGDEVAISLYDEDYNGKTYKKFKVPSRLDELEARVQKLEDNSF